MTSNLKTKLIPLTAAVALFALPVAPAVAGPSARNPRLAAAVVGGASPQHQAQRRQAHVRKRPIETWPGIGMGAR